MAIQRASNVKSRPRLPIPDEDPYSIASAHARLNLIDASDSSGYGGSNNVNNNTNNGGLNVHQPHHQHLLQHPHAGGGLMTSGVVVVVDDMGSGGINGGISAGNYDYSSRPHLFTHIHAYRTHGPALQSPTQTHIE